MKVSRRTFWPVATVCLLTGRAYSLDPAVHLSQYSHTAWRTQDGFFAGTPTAITQTKDGYLWIGTAAGLFRFDGVRFVPWEQPEAKGLMSAEVFSLRGTSDGSLWMGAAYSLFRWRGGQLTEYPAMNSKVGAIVERRNGTVWIARSRVGDHRGPLCEIVGQKLTCHGENEGVTIPYAESMVEDSQGDLWIAGSKLIRWRPGFVATHSLKGLDKSEGLHGIKALCTGADGSLWVGVSYPGRGLGLQELRDGIFKAFASPALSGTNLSVSGLVVDRDNAIWVGTLNQGLYRISAGKVDHFDSADGLSSDSVTALFQDHEGTMWVATSKGMDRFRGLSVISYSTREGLHADGVRSVLPAVDGTIWVGNAGSLDSIRGGSVSSILSQDGLPGREVTSLAQDRVGRLWVGVDDALFLFQHHTFTPVPLVERGSGPSIIKTITALIVDAHDDLWSYGSGVFASTFSHIHNLNVIDQITRPVLPMLLTLAPDPDGTVWAAGDLIKQFRGNREVASFKPPADYGYIRNMIAEADGTVWGAATGALVSWRKDKVQYLTIRNGLPCDHINTLVFDDNKTLWLYAQCGLIAISGSELQRWWNNPDTVVKTKVFDVLDGVSPAPSPYRPSAAKSADGRLWFANDSVLQMLDPSHLERNTIAPPVHIEQLSADGKSYPLKKEIRLPPLARDIEINYTALSFVIPQRVRFRYKLDGYDGGWQDAGSRRSAFYMNLSPGHYNFLVIGCNNDGIWNETGATIAFVISESWYQTTLFRLFCGLGAVALFYGFYHYRMRQISDSLKIRFNERLEERTRLARDLHDTLIQTIQGGKLVADDAREAVPDMARMSTTIDLLSDWLGKAVNEGRAALASLRVSTIEENDLAQALRRAAAECCIHNRIDVVFSVRGESKKMHPIARDEVFLIGHEAIQNACAHSGGARVTVDVEYGRHLRLRVADDGHGMDGQTLQFGKLEHFGLHGMRERAQRIGAKLMLASSQNGTEVVLLVPGKVLFK